jgi:hypothetical protein
MMKFGLALIVLKIVSKRFKMTGITLSRVLMYVHIPPRMNRIKQKKRASGTLAG